MPKHLPINRMSILKLSIIFFLFLTAYSLSAQLNPDDPLAGTRKLISQNELAFFFLQNEDVQNPNRTTTSMIFDASNGQFVTLDSSTTQAAPFIADSEGGTDFASGYFFGTDYGAATVFAYRSGSEDTGRATFRVDLQNSLGDNGPSPINTVPNAFVLGDLFLENIFRFLPQTEVAAGDFGPGTEDELFVLYTGADSLIKIHYYRLDLSLSGSDATIIPNLLDDNSIGPIVFETGESILQEMDAAAVDIDFDGKDELVVVYWNEDEVRMSVFEVNEQDNIQLRYDKQIFQTDTIYCNGGPASFGFDYLTLKVIGGDFVAEYPGEEIVVGMLFNSQDFSTGFNFGFYLLPLREEADSLLIPEWCDERDGEFYVNSGFFIRNDPASVSMAAGDLDGDLDDELVVGTQSIRVFQLEKGQIDDRNTIAIDDVDVFSVDGNWSEQGRFLDNFVAVGNIDRLNRDSTTDFRAEIFTVINNNFIVDFINNTRRQEFNLEIWRYPDTGGAIDMRNVERVAFIEDFIRTEEDLDIRRFSIGMVDVDGGGYQLGTPKRTSISEVLNPLLVLNAPPTHFDVFGNSSYDVSNLYGDNAPPPNINHFNSEYEEITEDESTFQTQFTSDWAVSKSVSAGFSFGGFSLGAKFSNTYSERFQRVEGSSKTISIKERRTALLDDELLAYLVDYDVFEYPVFQLGDTSVVTNVVVVVPGEIRKTFVGARSPIHNYIIDHQHGNLFSYKAKIDDLDPFVGSVYSFSGQEISKVSGFESDFTISWTDATSSGVEQEATTETTLGAEAGGAFKGFSLSASIEGTYASSEMQTRTSKYQQQVSMRGFFGQGEQGQIPGNYPYTVTPVTYWDGNGSLVLDYVVSLNNTGFWNTFYNTYDPAFLLMEPFKPEKGFEDPAFYNDADRYRTREILFSGAPGIGEMTTIRARVHNYGFLTTPLDPGLDVCFYYLDPSLADSLVQIGCKTIETGIQGRLDGFDNEIVEMDWSIPANLSADAKVVAILDPENRLPNEVHDFPQGNGVSNNVGWTCVFNPNCSLPANEETLFNNTVTSVKAPEVIEEGISIAPNPVNDWTWLVLEGQWKGRIQLNLVNAFGQSVKQWEVQAITGDDRIPFSVSDLPGGVYQLMLFDGEKRGRASMLIVD